MIKKAKYIYLALAILAITQLGWWAYLVISQQESLVNLQPSLNAAKELKDFKFMILAESLFAMLVWTIGVWLAYRAFDQQIQLREIQSNFISAVTHELKTPIANIQLCLDTLKRQELKEDQKTRYLNRAQESLNTLQEEVDRILFLNPKTALSITIEKLSLKTILEEIIQPLRSKYQSDINLNFFGKLEDLNVWAPQQESKLILNSILDNAIKYSIVKQKARNPINIEIRFSKSKKNGILEIIDHGMGLNKGEEHHVFDSFWRSEQSIEKAIPGTGIGLTIAKDLGKQYRIGVDLKANNYKGVTVQTTWPLTKA